MKGRATAASLLRELREEQGRTLRLAAGELGLAPSSLSRIERGERTVSPNLTERLADYYGVSSELLDIAEGRLPADLRAILLRHPEVVKGLRARYSNEETS